MCMYLMTDFSLQNHHQDLSHDPQSNHTLDSKESCMCSVQPLNTSTVSVAIKPTMALEAQTLL